MATFPPTLHAYLLERFEEEVAQHTMSRAEADQRARKLDQSRRHMENDAAADVREALLDRYAAPYLDRPDFRPEWR